MKKFLAILLSAMLMLSLAVPASAASVNNATSGHSYQAYQVFAGTQAATGVALGDVVWGNGVNGDALLAQLKNDYDYFDKCTSAADVADVLAGKADKCAEANALANAAADNRTSSFTVIAAGATEVQLQAGYWLLVDVTTIGNNYDARNSALLQVTQDGDINIEKKYNVPSVDKDITAVEDEEYSNGVEGADAEIGDDIEFTLTGTLPENLADYATYKYVFHDTLSNGLTYNGDVKVYLNSVSEDTQITSGFTVDPDTASSTGGGTLTITFANIKSNSNVTADSKIIVVYTAKLNNTANIGSTGNLNDVYLEYTNDPNHTGEGEPTTGNTPKDEVLVFTYELDVNKIDGASKETKLDGAEFVLLDRTQNKVATVVGDVLTSWVDVPAAVDGKITWPADTTLISENGKFIVKGLDSDTYYLRETKAPAGYNLLTSDIAITITATIDAADGEETDGSLDELRITINDEASEDGDIEKGIVEATVENNSGATLPETGGMGTTIFYIVGGLLAVGAAVLLITKKRMSAEG